MFRQVGRLGERAIAKRALERLVPVVCPLVDRQGPRDRKRLAAAGKVAYVRLYIQK
jgi:hypothetical protein